MGLCSFVTLILWGLSTSLPITGVVKFFWPPNVVTSRLPWLCTVLLRSTKFYIIFLSTQYAYSCFWIICCAYTLEDFWCQHSKLKCCLFILWTTSMTFGIITICKLCCRNITLLCYFNISVRHYGRIQNQPEYVYKIVWCNSASATMIFGD